MGTMISVLSLPTHVRTPLSSKTHNKNIIEGMKEHETTSSSNSKSFKSLKSLSRVCYMTQYCDAALLLFKNVVLVCIFSTERPTVLWIRVKLKKNQGVLDGKGN